MLATFVTTLETHERQAPDASTVTAATDSTPGWLVLAYQFPKGPDSRRVKVWRRLQSIGAIAIKNSVYVLPASEQSREDFEWLVTELSSGGADAVILESHVVGGMTDDNIRQLFNAARSDDYNALHQEMKTALAAMPPGEWVENEDVRAAAKSILGRSAKRFAEIEAIDFFTAAGHDELENELRVLSQRLSDVGELTQTEDAAMASDVQKKLTGLTWVTRSGVKVDRVASAWLVRRWIDSAATFKFVNEKDYTPEDGEIRFDMFDAEITHEGDRCTFEVLANRVNPQDMALRNVGEVVHDIDLKDGKFDRVETPGIANLLTGVFSRLESDDERIERASSVFDDLYRYYETAQA